MAKLIDWAAELAAWDAVQPEMERRRKETVSHVREMWEQFPAVMPKADQPSRMEPDGDS